MLLPWMLLLACALAACDEGPGSYGDDLTDPQLPPRGREDVQDWIAAGHYRDWHCEAAAHAARSPSPHGTNRVCSNDLLHASTGAGELAVGVASVKEIFDGDALITYAVSRKMYPGRGGSGWYWYEGNDDKTYANGEGAGNCTSCHSEGQRDYVFTIVQ